MALPETTAETDPIHRLLLLGVSARSVAAPLRDPLFAEEPNQARLVAGLQQLGCEEGLVVATCERIEFLVVARPGQRVAGQLLQLIAAAAGCAPADLAGQSYCHMGADALRHLMAVAASLESQVVGEPQVLGQVKQCYRAAQDAALAGPYIAAACQADVDAIEDELAEMMAVYSDDGHGIVLERVSGGWAFRASEHAHEALARLAEPSVDVRLSAAALETLAVIAYLQPVSRPDVARIRGVSADAAVANLLDRGLIEEAGRSESGAMTFRTTATFERAFGLSGITALPELDGFRPADDDVEALRARLEQVAAARVE